MGRVGARRRNTPVFANHRAGRQQEQERRGQNPIKALSPTGKCAPGIWWKGGTHGGTKGSDVKEKLTILAPLSRNEPTAHTHTYRPPPHDTIPNRGSREME